MISQLTERQLEQKLTVLLAVKKIFFGFNFLIWAAGCVAACIGIWFRIDRDFTTLIQRIGESDISLKSAEIYLGANLLIAVGCTIAFVGLLGSISISKENDIFLFVYAALMFCVFGLYVTCAIWGFVRLDYLKGIVSDAMRELFNKAMIEKLSSAQYTVNEIQKQLQCCGNVGPSEYAGDIPPSCSSWIIGCNQAFFDFYWRNTLLLSLIGLVFGLLQIIAIGFAIFFANEIRIAKKFIQTFEKYGTKKPLIQ